MGDTANLPQPQAATLQQKLTAFAILDSKHKADGALLAEARRILTGELEQDWKETGSKSRVLRAGEQKIATASVNENSTTVEVTDPEAYLRWVEENYPTEVDYVLVPAHDEAVIKEAFSKKHLSPKRLEVMLGDDGQPVLDDDGKPIVVDKVLTGLPVPGVRIKKGTGIKSFTIRPEKDVDVAALADGFNFSILETPKQIEADAIVESDADFVADGFGDVYARGQQPADDIVDAEVVDDTAA